ncbi:MAG: molecular chaperone DnaK [Planctomycetota bacterium]
MGIGIGIDLGTTNSVVSAFIDGTVVPITNASGSRTMPSMVSFMDDGSRLVGHAAKKQQITSPKSTIYSIKRFMGRRHAEVTSEEKLVPYEVVGKSGELVRVRAGKKLITPQEVSALILEELRSLAEAEIGEAVTESVITVPAYFNDAQRQATKEAAALAGMNARRIINEPTAAALAYGFDAAGFSRRVVVVDFGGGTLDLSAMEIADGHFHVLGVHGNTHLGGDDFDQRIIDVVADDFFRHYQINLREDPMALQRLKDAAQMAKAELSSRESTEIVLPYVAVSGSGALHLQYTLTRSTFERICADLIDSVRACCSELRQTTGVGAGPNMEVILVGGSTRMPCIRDAVAESFDTERLNKSVNPDEVVAAGAGTLAAVLAGQVRNVNLMDVTSQTLGVETAGGGVSVLVPKNTPIPTTIKRVYSTTQKNQTSVPVNVLEGDAAVAAKNRTLGLFRLKGIKRPKHGQPKIEVAFDIDADGILSVTATDVATKKSQEVVIQGGSGLDPSEMQRLVDESKGRREASDARKDTEDLVDHANGVLTNIVSWMQHNRDYIGSDELATCEKRIARLKYAVGRRHTKNIRRALLSLDDTIRASRAA